MKASAPVALIGGFVVLVTVAVIGGLLALPSPSEERARRLDERRVEDLRGISRAMDLYWTRTGRLPGSLRELSGESGVSISIDDPGTAEDYELRLLDGAAYELCANFETSGPDEAAAAASDVSEDFWSHGIGRQCFPLVAQDVPSREPRQL